MHNNRAYMQETMLVEQMAGRHQRPIERSWIGTALADPYIDYARMATNMGVEAEGPIAFAIALMAACGQCQAEDTVNSGRDVYMQKGCFTCHGTVGQGGAGPRVAPVRWPLEAFAAYVRNPIGWMPSYQFQVTDAELVSIRAYLASISAPPQPDQLPLLRH